MGNDRLERTNRPEWAETGQRWVEVGSDSLEWADRPWWTETGQRWVGRGGVCSGHRQVRGRCDGGERHPNIIYKV